VSDGFVIIASPYLLPLVPAGQTTSLGTFTFIPSCIPTQPCTGIYEDLDDLGPAILDLHGLPIESRFVFRDDAPEPSTLASVGLGLAALALSRLAAARTAASARPRRWLRAA
jgi:hypothetical protein